MKKEPLLVRCLAPDEAITDGQLTARRPDADYSALAQVCNGPLATQYISASYVDPNTDPKSLKSAIAHYGGVKGAEDQALYNLLENSVVLRLAIVGGRPVLLLYSRALCKAAGFNARGMGLASHAYEVLFLRHAPVECIIVDETTWDAGKTLSEAEFDALETVFLRHYPHGSFDTFLVKADTEKRLDLLYAAMVDRDVQGANAAAKFALEVIPRKNAV